MRHAKQRAKWEAERDEARLELERQREEGPLTEEEAKALQDKLAKAELLFKNRVSQQQSRLSKRRE